METPEQAFVEYASSRTDEAKGNWYTFKPEQNNLDDTYSSSWRSHPNLRFLATANAVIDCRMAKIAVGEGITRLIFSVKGINLDGIGVKPPYYARKDLIDCHLPGEWEISRDAELNPFKNTLVFRILVEFLGAIPINFKCNMWESKDLIGKPIDWSKPPKNRDGVWHAKIWLIDHDGEKFTKTPQSIPTTKKLSKRESTREFINLDHFYDTECVTSS
uniref:MAK10-like protein n=1 Tax=Tanacetum cinerariifolium TaxID=118510 RepID=A0A6L2L469_TANCI|nr:MAK10-like protein [Tanacetum cinerariifolium]